MTETGELKRAMSHSGVRAHPFFLIGALYAVLMVALWVPWFLGFIQVPSAWPAQAWFNHAIMFGFAPAIIAGYLLTVIASETGSELLRGRMLAAFAGLWLAGRIAMGMSAHLDAATAATLSAVFLIALATLAALGLSTRTHRSNLVLIVLGLGLSMADVFYHYEMQEFGRTKFAQNLGLSVVLLLLMLIAVRIASAFASNPLTTDTDVPQPPLRRYDVATWMVTAAALSVWTLSPWLLAYSIDRRAVGALLLVGAILNLAYLARLANWRLAGFQVAYVFAAVGLALTALGVMWDDYDFASGGLQAWSIGAIGAMSLAIAAWASRARRAPDTAGAIILYALAFIAGLASTIAGLYPQWTLPLMPVSAIAWIAAFGGFTVLYGRARPSRA